VSPVAENAERTRIRSNIRKGCDFGDAGKMRVDSHFFVIFGGDRGYNAGTAAPAHPSVFSPLSAFTTPCTFYLNTRLLAQ
jgi:hypothetical protein